MSEQWIALLGRCDQPTDAVADYCKFLSAALCNLGIELQLDRCDWDVAGWANAREALRERAASWRGRRVLVQYTALAWSARGFPVRFLSVLKLLRQCGARIAVVYHDAEPYSGGRLIDRFRRAAQLRTMRRALRLADAAILTVPADKLSWLRGKTPPNAVFIPVGANLPIADPAAGIAPANANAIAAPARDAAKTVAVFGVTGGQAGRPEVLQIADAVRFAAARLPLTRHSPAETAGAASLADVPLRLVVLGRETETLAQPFENALRGSGVTVSVLGMLPGEGVVRTLRAADVALFVRAAISSRRSSAIAAIACGVPLIAWAGSETAPPITEAGVVFYSRGEPDEPGRTLARVLTDVAYRAALAEQSRRAYAQHFSWTAIARAYASALL